MILLIDGRSGSGKSELATLIGLPVVRLDDIYPGWDGLLKTAAELPTIIRAKRWQRYDWALERRAEWQEFDEPVVIEGCGALTAASRALVDHAVWVALDGSARRARALAREPSFEPHWQQWAAQEDAHIALHDPLSLADEIVDGTDVSLVAARWRGILDPARVEQ